MHDFTRLRVWQRARSLTSDVYQLTSAFPQSELFGLTQQIRRCAGSIGANLAEGAGRETRRDFARFVTMALGSLNELEHHCFIATDLGLLNTDQLTDLRTEIGEVRAMTVTFRRTLRRDA